MLRIMDFNVTESSVTLGAKSIGIVQYICQTFLIEGVGTTSGHHLIPSFETNFYLSTLEEQNIFISAQHKRDHTRFKFQTGLLEGHNHAALIGLKL